MTTRLRDKSSVLAFVGPTHNADGQECINAAHHRIALSPGRAGPMACAMIDMLTGWELYAAAHKERYESGIGEDYCLGEYWAEIGLGIKRLLDGETGGLDCGSLAHNITAAIRAEGFDTDGYVLNSKDSDE